MKTRQWQYKRVKVCGDEIIDIPTKAKSVQLRPVSKRDYSYVEWLEPVEDQGEC